MNQKTLDKIAVLAETLDNSLFMAKENPYMSAEIHKKGLMGTVKNTRDELLEIYKENGGTDELNIQA